MNETYYSRDQVLEIFGVQESFLDELEREELIICSILECAEDKVYPVDQIERIRIISTLVHELEVNLPGVEVILQMRENMILMRRQFDQILQALVKEIKLRLP
ncbi:MAG: MerR family transcriptional regulator [Deltaproteobacteria bacterium]|jgi:MerR family transcriptional regulator/heat shock protein HspR|nr:MerR family transcriptional regulator [Deltaproteobacteria bacterium]